VFDLRKTLVVETTLRVRRRKRGLLPGEGIAKDFADSASVPVAMHPRRSFAWLRLARRDVVAPGGSS